ncbi:MAG: hypothetical protein HGB12_08020 [Bacteroidetes bacterium]|nr:hypothetical protein [Bacteroidota bacterium]
MQNKETVNWVLRNILIPLTPFVIGAFLRFVYTKSFGIALFNESELSLSMGLLCIIMIKSANKLSDETLGDNLANVLIMFALVFIVIFACTSFLKFHMDIKATKQLKDIIHLSATNAFNLKSDQIYMPEKDDFYGMLSMFKYSTFLLTSIIIPTVISFRYKYNLS